MTRRSYMAQSAARRPGAGPHAPARHLRGRGAGWLADWENERETREEIVMENEIKQGDKVRIEIAKPGQWVTLAVERLNGQIGTIEEVGPSKDRWDRSVAVIYTVRFETPIEPWSNNASPVTAFHFEAADLRKA